MSVASGVFAQEIAEAAGENNAAEQEEGARQTKTCFCKLFHWMGKVDVLKAGVETLVVGGFVVGYRLMAI